jgi:hypothetical protein
MCGAMGDTYTVFHLLRTARVHVPSERCTWGFRTPTTARETAAFETYYIIICPSSKAYCGEQRAPSGWERTVEYGPGPGKCSDLRINRNRLLLVLTAFHLGDSDIPSPPAGHSSSPRQHLPPTPFSRLDSIFPIYTAVLLVGSAITTPHMHTCTPTEYSLQRGCDELKKLPRRFAAVRVVLRDRLPRRAMVRFCNHTAGSNLIG